MRTASRKRVLVTLAALAVSLAVVAGAMAGTKAEPWDGAVAANAKFTKLPSLLPIKKTSKPIPEGKYIVYIHCGVPACSIIADAIKRAADVLRWKYETIATNGTVESVANAWATAVRKKPNAVFSSGYDRAIYEKSLQQLKKMGIGVFNYATLDKPGNGITHMSGDGPAVGIEGTVQAAHIIATLKDKANTVWVDLPSFTILQGTGKAFKRDYAKWCPSCPLDVLDLPITALGKDANDRVVSYLRSHPDVNWVAYSYDGASVGLPAALKAAGLDKKVRFSGSSPSSENLGYVLAGQEAAVVQQPHYELWASMVDAAARWMTGQPYSKAIPMERFIVTKANVPSGTKVNPVVPDLYGKLAVLWGKKK